MKRDLLNQSLNQLEAGKRLYKPERPAPISEEEKAARLAHWDIMLALWAGLHDCFGYSFTRQYGTAEEDTIKTWARALYSKSAYVLPALELVLAQWRDDFPPNLPQFQEFLALAYDKAQRARKPAPQPTKAPQLPERVTKRSEPTQAEIEARAEITRITSGPKTRDEDFKRAYNHLCASRWGPL